jgi:altronate dehydratase large subunit
MTALQGYKRPDGRMGIRNHVIVVSTMDNANPTVRRVASIVRGVVPVCSTFGRANMGDDIPIHFRVLANMATHPNVYGVIIISLDDESHRKLRDAVAAAGCPVVSYSIEEDGGTLAVAQKASSDALRMVREAALLRPQPMEWSDLVLGVECGGSDGTSGIVSNPATGMVADMVIDRGGTVIMSETLEMLGGEHLLAARAATPEVAKQITEAVEFTIDYAARKGIDLLGTNPVPDNIKGGLSTIEEKALGAIKKGGSRPLVEVMPIGVRPTKKGFTIMDAPCPGVENLTSIASGGCQAIIFSTGKGNCSGHPVVPVIKVSGNPHTVEMMKDNIDVDLSYVFTEGASLEDASLKLERELIEVCWGKPTTACVLGEIEVAISRYERAL